MEEFNKKHNIEKTAQNIEKKVVPADLKVTSGDVEHSIGGRTRTDTKQIENGTTSRTYDLKWRINLKEKPSTNK